RAVASRRNSSQKAASRLTEVRCPDSVSDRLTGRSAFIVPAVAVELFVGAPVLGLCPLALGPGDAGCLGPGGGLALLVARHLLAPGSQVDDTGVHWSLRIGPTLLRFARVLAG